jgi:hypothetical protein
MESLSLLPYSLTLLQPQISLRYISMTKYSSSITFHPEEFRGEGGASGADGQSNQGQEVELWPKGTR